MKLILRLRLSRVCLALALASLVLVPPAIAFPPVPHHVLYGLVRDEYGTPLLNAQATLVLQTPTGVQLTATITPGIALGENFEIKVPMDAGLTPDPYQPTALRSAAPFKIFVVLAQTTNLPIQMTGNYSLLGKPGQRTRVDLTLGVDSNGDGLPDAWELAFLAALGSPLSLSDLHLGMDVAGDGRTLQQEFLLGAYPFNPGQSFLVNLVGFSGGSPLLEFTTMTGRSYTVLGSSDLSHWTTLAFQIPAEGVAGAAHSYYSASDIRVLQVQALQPASGPPLRFFRLMLQ